MKPFIAILAIALALTPASRVQAQGQALYVANTGAGTVLRIDLATLSGRILLSSLPDPTGLAISSAGTLFVATSGDGVIRQVSGPDGHLAITPVGSGFGQPRHLVADQRGGIIFVAGGEGGGRIVQLQPGQQPVFFPFGPGQPVPFDLRQIPSSAGTGNGITGMALGRRGELYFSVSGRDSSMLKVALRGDSAGEVTPWGLNGGAAPLAVDADGTVFAGSNGSILRLEGESCPLCRTGPPFRGTRVGTWQRLPDPAGQAGMIDLVDLAVDGRGNILALSREAGTVFLVTPEGAVRPLISSGLDRPMAMALGPAQFEPAPVPVQQVADRVSLRISNIKSLALDDRDALFAANGYLYRLGEDGGETMLRFPRPGVGNFPLNDFGWIAFVAGGHPVPGGIQNLVAVGMRNAWLIQGGVPVAIPKQFQFATGLGYCGDGTIYVVDQSASAVYRIGTDADVRVFAYGLARPTVAVCGYDSTLYVTSIRYVQLPANHQGIRTDILRSQNGSPLQPFAADLMNIKALALGPDGKLYASIADTSAMQTGAARDLTYEIIGFDAAGTVDWRMPNVDGSGGLAVTHNGVIYAVSDKSPGVLTRVRLPQ